MSTASTLFVLNASGDFELNRIEAKRIEEYNVLIVRDKGGVKGDYDGRRKMTACNELYYIYLVYDPRSMYYNLPIHERKIKAKQDAKLPDIWKEDEAIKDAILRYQQDFKLISSGQAYVVAERAYHMFSKDTEEFLDEIVNLKHLLKGLSNKLNATSVTKLGDMEVVSVGQQISAILGEISKTQTTINKNISEFPKLQATVKELATKFADEGGSMRVLVGGGEIGNREA